MLFLANTQPGIGPLTLSMGTCPSHNITKKHVTGRNTRTKLIQEYLPGNSLHQSMCNSSDNLEDALHPKTPIQLSLDRGPTSLPSGRRHFNLPWYLRQGQYLEVFPRLYSYLCWRTSVLVQPPDRCSVLDHPTAQPPTWFHPRWTALRAPAVPGNVLRCIPVVGAPVTQPWAWCSGQGPRRLLD